MVYAAEEDPLCYPGTTVLRNLLDIHDQAELDGDTLTICIQSNKDEPRPNEFQSPAGSQLWLIVLQRSKE